MLHVLGKVRAGDELGDQVAQAVLSADVVHGHDAGVVQACEDAPFFEVCLRLFVGTDQVEMRHLDGDFTPQVVVSSLVNDAESTFTQLARNAIAAELGRRGRLLSRHGRLSAGGR